MDGTARLWHIPALPPPPPSPTAAVASYLSAHGAGLLSSMASLTHPPSPSSLPPSASFRAATAAAAMPSPTQALPQQQQLVCMHELPHPDFVTSACFHPLDSRVLATGCADGRVRVWDAAAARVVAAAAVPHDMVTSLAWLPTTGGGGGEAGGGGTGHRLVVGTLQGMCR